MRLLVVILLLAVLAAAVIWVSGADMGRVTGFFSRAAPEAQDFAGNVLGELQKLPGAASDAAKGLGAE